MPVLLNLASLTKRIETLYKQHLESPLPDSEFNQSFLMDAIVDVLRRSVFNVNEWQKYGFRVVHGNTGSIFKGCFCKEDERSLKRAIELGSGAFGTVHKSRAPSCIKGIPKDVEWVAIKMETIGSFFSKDQTPEYLRKHISILQDVGNAGLTPKVFDTFICIDEKGQNTIIKVMEYVDGITLHKWIETASVANRKKAQTILQEKVQQLGQMGILHSDLHGGNIMVVPTAKGGVRDVVIIDFDLAKRADTSELNRVKNIFMQDSFFYSAANKILGQLVREKSIVL
jgi:predicted Ser/Thr protein kinase